MASLTAMVYDTAERVSEKYWNFSTLVGDWALEMVKKDPKEISLAEINLLLEFDENPLYNNAEKDLRKLLLALGKSEFLAVYS